MSLDLYLRGPPHKREGSTGIFIRAGGETFEITRAEWDRRQPGHEPVVAVQDDETTEIWHRNITHNLCEMAMHAGLYEPLWRPDESGLTHAHMLTTKIEHGLELLKSDPGKFKMFTPP